MGGKRKGKKKTHADHNVEAADELVALQAIYGSDLDPDRDRHGFQLLVVPHPVRQWSSRISSIKLLGLHPKLRRWNQMRACMAPDLQHM